MNNPISSSLEESSSKLSLTTFTLLIFDDEDFKEIYHFSSLTFSLFFEPTSLAVRRFRLFSCSVIFLKRFLILRSFESLMVITFGLHSMHKDLKRFLSQYLLEKDFPNFSNLLINGGSESTWIPLFHRVSYKKVHTPLSIY